MIVTRIRSAFLAGVRGLALMLMSVTASVVLFTFTVVSLALIPIGIGLFATPAVLTLLRSYAGRRRLLAREWSDVPVPSPYRPMPAGLRGGFAGQVERCALMLRDPATWRDLLWLLVDMTAGCVSALLPAALFLYPVESLVLAAGLWRLFTEGGAYWYGPVAVHSQGTALLAVAFGLVVFAGALRCNPALLRAHFALTRSLLGPTKEMELARRVDRLTESRHDAVDGSAAELRRIERDLHDGAQARLVAMGMNLGTIEALVEKDPAQAKKLLAMARTSSAEALTELRDLVRGIHPPVLAERGLGDAVRALALRLPIETEVTVDLAGRADAPAESAAYFAVSEVFTNAVKHSGADRIHAGIHHAGGMLRIYVADDGQGGAALGAGSGLSGIERRLGTFDGVLAVSSPAGGPTMVTMEIPCELS